MPEPKAQLVDPQGPIDVPGINATGTVSYTHLTLPTIYSV